MDLRTAFGDEPPDDPDVGIGIVRSDGQGGTFIEVQCNHFCTICTGYCLPYPPPDSPPPPPPPPDDCPDGPGPNQPGNSVIDKREGFLQETHTLPGMTEFGVPWNLSLVYSSQTANPSVTLRGYVDYNSTRPVERTIFEFNVEGIKAEAAYDYSENNQKHHATYIWNGRNVFGDLSHRPRLSIGNQLHDARYQILRRRSSVIRKYSRHSAANGNLRPCC